ncbi:hypothetical protein BGZ91_006423, partial [Linnemannia elongata]
RHSLQRWSQGHLWRLCLHRPVVDSERDPWLGSCLGQGCCLLGHPPSPSLPI